MDSPSEIAVVVPSNGWYGWLALAAVVAVADVWAVKKGLETMTAAYKRCPRWVSVPATAVTVAHLLGWLPEQLDPFERLGRFLTPRVDGNGA